MVSYSYIYVNSNSLLCPPCSVICTMVQDTRLVNCSWTMSSVTDCQDKLRPARRAEQGFHVVNGGSAFDDDQHGDG